jgi:hypothetical protein
MILNTSEFGRKISIGQFKGTLILKIVVGNQAFAKTITRAKE